VSVPHIAGRERDLWFTTFTEYRGVEIQTGGWPKYEVVCQKWSENAAGERRLIEERRRWYDFTDEGESP
jgi:hypothetical protein